MKFLILNYRQSFEKKAYLLSFFVICYCFSSFAQGIVKPRLLENTQLTIYGGDEKIKPENLGQTTPEELMATLLSAKTYSLKDSLTIKNNYYEKIERFRVAVNADSLYNWMPERFLDGFYVKPIHKFQFSYNDTLTVIIKSELFLNDQPILLPVSEKQKNVLKIKKPVKKKYQFMAQRINGKWYKIYTKNKKLSEFRKIISFVKTVPFTALVTREKEHENHILNTAIDLTDDGYGNFNFSKFQKLISYHWLPSKKDKEEFYNYFMDSKFF